MCGANGVNEVFILLLIRIRSMFFLVISVKKKGFALIYNKNINLNNLLKDGLHLFETRKIKLAVNFIYFLKKIFLAISVRLFISHRQTLKYLHNETKVFLW